MRRGVECGRVICTFEGGDFNRERLAITQLRSHQGRGFPTKAVARGAFGSPPPSAYDKMRNRNRAALFAESDSGARRIHFVS